MPDYEGGPRRVVEVLGEDECWGLLASGALGRLVHNSRYGLIALPVVYRIDQGSLVLGTWDPALFDEDLRTGIAEAGYQVAVEADQIDVKARTGGSSWSGARCIIWTTRPSARRSPMPGSSRGSRGYLRTPSG